jgi:hypothetical protein
MKHFIGIILLIVATLSVTGCSEGSSTTYQPPATEKPCGMFDGKQLYKDGSSCYYYEDTARTKKRQLNPGNCEC